MGSVYALESTPNCTNLPTDYRGSIRTTGCIAVYQRTDCSGRSFVVRSDKIELRELTNLTIMPTGPGARLDLEWDLYRDSEKMELETHGGITCECIWLTWRNYAGFFANTHGSCFKVYNNADCKGNPVSEVNGHSEDIPDGGEDGGSMQLCNMPPHCLSSFTATVLNMKLIESHPKLFQATTPKPKMFVNNGNNETEEFITQRKS
ncbi:hypothetical protein Ocin01_18395 [Orchesella cincta]|uniref:Uncharacterized protein n=1 Tax=Orchesella cincta TaxID=48709 RepID=A0A1D2M5M8_ORCCI|nr:hypothetical protein Ocin01_18395 [Orchesella cincta]